MEHRRLPSQGSRRLARAALIALGFAAIIGLTVAVPLLLSVH